jgi:aminoglycoside phosphotransferase (APT) family kinase protein
VLLSDGGATAREWDADVELGPEAAVRLIEAQFPALAPVRLESLGVGWDNLAFRVNDRFVFRFPRRRIAAALIEREARALPLLAPHLPLPVPAPEFVGAPAEGYPFPFSGYPLLPGTTADRVDWSQAERGRTAAPLARFLAALHGIPVDDATRGWAPGDEIERANIAKRAPRVKERLRGLDNRPGGADRALLLDRIDRLAATPAWTGPGCWVHGDFYARHLLVDADRCPCGVIDWGDVHLGDPALDLSIAFSCLPPGARAAFREAYGSIDAATWERARFRALHYSVLLIEYGTVAGDAAIRRAGEYALLGAAR